MSIPRIVSAMEYIDDDLVSGAVTYTRQKRKWWTNWKAIAACVAVVAIVFGVIPFFNNSPVGSPFVLTAYAAGIDNTVSAVELKEGENIPVSFFEANTHTILSSHENFRIFIGYFYFNKFVIFTNNNCIKTVFTNILVFHKRSFLCNPLLGNHK